MNYHRMLQDQRPTILEINLASIAENLGALRKYIGNAKVMAIVKANAYGHGLIECAKRLEAEKVDYLGVAFVEEGIELRKAGVKTPVLVLGGVSGAQIKLFLDHDLSITASSISKLERIDGVAAGTGKKARVHLKIDTGMERIGVHYYSAEKFLERSLACKNIEVVGVYSHLATGEEQDTSFAKLQLERFLEAINFYSKRSLPTPIRHIANSGAILQLRESHLDLVRPGIALYGVAPAPHLTNTIPLLPALSLRSRVVYFKVVKSGASVSYGRAWTASEDTRVVTIPIGYGDGYPRALSNRAEVVIGGKRRAVVGSVCMDQVLVNIGPKGEAFNGDEVICIGEQGGERITVNDLAQWAGTVPHEILTMLNLRIPRLYV